MHIDLRTAKPTELTAEVAIVGSGAAGQTMARALAEAGCPTLLIESGGLDYEPETAALNIGRSVGQHYYDLQDARLRLFGGTTAIWGGRCAEFQPIDFAARPWVRGSGWPFGAEELTPFYDRAWRLVGIGPDAPSPGAPPALRPLTGGNIVPLHWRIDRQAERFQAGRNGDMFGLAALTVVTHATVREIIPSSDGNEIDRLKVVGPGGEILTAKARAYVIAAGGIENARLLLASNSVQPAGLGNGNDLVGRFFMEHPHARGGRIDGNGAWPFSRAFEKSGFAGGNHDVAWLLAAAPAAQERAGLLNGALTIAPRPPAGSDRPLLTRAYVIAKHRIAPTKNGRRLWQGYKRLGRAVRGNLTPSRRWLGYRTGKNELAIVLRAEQSPNPDSRVRLSAETDALGMPKVELDWRLQRQDRDSAAGLVQLLGKELLRLGISVEPAKWLAEEAGIWVSDPLVSIHPLAGFHHMGTTRMSDDPRQGVTDRWGRVHGIGNLYIAGSSLFPTSGWANPTLTILALSLRTADRLLASRAQGWAAPARLRAEAPEMANSRRRAGNLF